MQEAIRKADVLIEALPYIQSFAGKPVVIKFGGNAMESDEVLDDVLEDVVFLAAVGIRPVVVHGGGPHISRAMERGGLEPRFVHGLRITDAAALEVVVRTLTDDVNADVRERIHKFGGRAESTFDGEHSLLRAARKVARVRTGTEDEAEVDLGFVGRVVAVETEHMLRELARGTVLVVPPVGQDDAGQLYNLNADTAAAGVAAALRAEKVVFLTNVHGIMADPDDPDSLLSTAGEPLVRELVASGAIHGGMLPKVEACLSALDAGVPKAHIVDGRLPHALLLEIFTDKGVGTQILTEAAPD